MTRWSTTQERAIPSVTPADLVSPLLKVTWRPVRPAGAGSANGVR